MSGSSASAAEVEAESIEGKPPPLKRYTVSVRSTATAAQQAIVSEKLAALLRSLIDGELAQQHATMIY